MRCLRYILPVLLTAFLIAGCRSVSLSKKQDRKEQESSRVIHSLLESPSVSELTASLSLNLNGTKVSGQLRMRRGRSIQISASMLGLVEVARIEFLPEMVVIADRFHNLYSVCHYADIPYRNEFGLDFDVIEALLWNRMFSPGSSSEADAAARLQVIEKKDNGTMTVKDMECGYLFITDGVSRLDAVSKTGDGYKIRIDYSDFNALSGKFLYPLGLSMLINVIDSRINASVKLTSVSTDVKNWPDRTHVSRRMKQVSLDELLDNLDL